MPELLLGCGNSRVKKVRVPGTPEDFSSLVSLDLDESTGCDVVFNLDDIWRKSKPLPFPADHFSEIHAYEVLEHIGVQGDLTSFFLPFYEIWRVLRPGGYLCATCPKPDSLWAWGDPGHRRVISKESLVFLSQREYARQVGTTPMSDYRWLWDGDFELVAYQESGESSLFALQAMKPARTERTLHSV